MTDFTNLGLTLQERLWRVMEFVASEQKLSARERHAGPEARAKMELRRLPCDVLDYLLNSTATTSDNEPLELWSVPLDNEDFNEPPPEGISADEFDPKWLIDELRILHALLVEELVDPRFRVAFEERNEPGDLGDGPVWFLVIRYTRVAPVVPNPSVLND